MTISFGTFSKLTAGLMIAAIVASCGNKEQAKTSAPATTASAAKATEPIVFVNSDSLVSNYNYFKDIKTRLEAKSKKAQQDLSSKGTAFQREVADYQQKAQGMS